MKQRRHKVAVPAWVLKAFDAPPRFADIAAMRQRILDEPQRLLMRIVPEIDSQASLLGTDESWKTNVLRTIYRAWLEHEPEVTSRTKDAVKAQAERAAAVAKAAERLLSELESARRGLDACRLDGVEPVLLSAGLDSLEIDEATPFIESLLNVARKRGKAPTRKGGYAAVATLTRHLDAASTSLGFILSAAAAADFFELADLSAKRSYTEDQIRKARDRTIRS